MTCEFVCPACGKKLFSYEQGTRKYGCMIRECKKCKNKYIDPRYHEMAIEGIPDGVFRIPPYIGIFVIGVLLIWRAIYLFGVRQLGTPDNMQWLLPGLFLVMGIALIIGAIFEIIMIKTGGMAKKYERLYEESVQRMKDKEYTDILRRLGYRIPDAF